MLLNALCLSMGEVASLNRKHSSHGHPLPQVSSRDTCFAKRWGPCHLRALEDILTLQFLNSLWEKISLIADFLHQFWRGKGKAVLTFVHLLLRDFSRTFLLGNVVCTAVVLDVLPRKGSCRVTCFQVQKQCPGIWTKTRRENLSTVVGCGDMSVFSKDVSCPFRKIGMTRNSHTATLWCGSIEPACLEVAAHWCFDHQISKFIHRTLSPNLPDMTEIDTAVCSLAVSARDVYFLQCKCIFAHWSCYIWLVESICSR